MVLVVGSETETGQVVLRRGGGSLENNLTAQGSRKTLSEAWKQGSFAMRFLIYWGDGTSLNSVIS